MPLTTINHGRLSGRVAILGGWKVGGDLGVGVRLDVDVSVSASGWGVCRLSCTAMWILFPFPPLNSVPSMEHANACHWGSSHAPGFQPRPAAKLTSQPSALCDMTLAKDQGLRTRHWSQAPGIEIGIGTARSTKDQGPGVGVCLARSEAFRGSQVMYAIIRRGPFATPVLLQIGSSAMDGHHVM